ncbi:MAG: hypothetical protein Q9213_001790 [Squamulea squamosa]
MLTWDPAASRAEIDGSQKGKRKREAIDKRGGQSQVADLLEATDAALPETSLTACSSVLSRDENSQLTGYSASQEDFVLGFVDQLIEASVPSQATKMDNTPIPSPASSFGAGAGSAHSDQVLDWRLLTAGQEITATHQSPLIRPVTDTQEITSDQISQLVRPDELHYSPDTDFQVACHMGEVMDNEPLSKRPRILLKLRQPKPQPRPRVVLRLTKPRQPSRAPRGKRSGGRTRG